jgi:hypothetical protein
MTRKNIDIGKIVFMGLVGFWRTVLLTDRSDSGGVNRPVDDQGKTRPENTDFGGLFYETLNRVFTLASQVVNLDLGKM